MSKTILAFTGFAGSGKDTACARLVQEHGCTRVGFADPLKRMAKIAFDFTDEQLWGPSEKRNAPDERHAFSGTCPGCGVKCQSFIGRPRDNFLPEGYVFNCMRCDVHYAQHVSPRLALQTLGTEWGRRLSADIWAKALVTHVRREEPALWCVNDLRFRNEAKELIAAGAVCVRLLRGEKAFAHESEAQIETLPVQETIDNREMTIPELHQAIDGLAAKYL